MMRQTEFKMKFDPNLGKYIKQHIYGEGMMDAFKSFGSEIFGKTMKTAAKKAVTTAASKTGKYAGKKAGDKMVQMLSKSGEKKIPKKVKSNTTVKRVPIKKMTSQEINQRVNQILSGGRIRKKKK